VRVGLRNTLVKECNEHGLRGLCQCDSYVGQQSQDQGQGLGRRRPRWAEHLHKATANDNDQAFRDLTTQRKTQEYMTGISHMVQGTRYKVQGTRHKAQSTSKEQDWHKPKPKPASTHTAQRSNSRAEKSRANQRWSPHSVLLHAQCQAPQQQEMAHMGATAVAMDRQRD